MPNNMPDTLDQFLDAVFKAALWSTTDDKDKPLDQSYSVDDFDPEAKEIITTHAKSFWYRTYFYLSNEGSASELGHDFWLTSQGHGSGFWDGDWPTYGEMFTKLAQHYPTMDLTVEGSKIYL